jgi:2-oxoglutarate ferredoxin oxidoreductase subunit delta
MALPASVGNSHNLNGGISTKFVLIFIKEARSMPARGWIEVNEQYCKGCELCISACPPVVMALDLERLTPKGYHPAHLIKDGCTGCAICALVCPDAAITVYREVTKAPAAAAAGG